MTELLASAERFTDAPEWTTLREAAFLVRVPPDQIQTWADAGLVSAVPWPSKRDPITVLFRTEDVRRMSGSSFPPAPTFVLEQHADIARPDVRRLTRLTDGYRLTRRSVLAALAMMVAGGAASAARIAQIADPDMRLRNLATDRIGGKPTTPSPKHSGTQIASRTTSRTPSPSITSSTRQGAGGATSGHRAPVIDSVSVAPDPVLAGGTATITIDASPRGRIASYSLVVSDGTVKQDPRSPSRWVWSER